MSNTRTQIGSKIPPPYESRKSVRMNNNDASTDWAEAQEGASTRFKFPVYLQSVDGVYVNDWTIGIWVRWDVKTARTQMVPASLLTGSYDHQSIFITNFGALIWFVDDVNFVIAFGTNLNNGNWHYVSIKHQRGAGNGPGRLSYSIDGAAWTVYATASVPPLPPATPDKWLIGGYRTGTSPTTLNPATMWNGWIDDFVAWNFPMSNADVAEYYNNGKPVNPDTIEAVQEDQADTPGANEEVKRCVWWIPMGLHDGTAVNRTDPTPHITNHMETPFGPASFDWEGTPAMDGKSIPE